MTDDKFPLCRALGVEITNPTNWPPQVNLNQDMVRASEIEAALQKAPVVAFNDDKTMSPTWECSSHITKNHTHTARLVCIEPIVKDTAESLLRELIDLNDGNEAKLPLTWFNRARKLLEEK